MSTRLGAIVGERLAVACQSCARRGSYVVARLVERHGPDLSDLNLLRILTASCRYQRGPGAAAPRKYEVKCQARLILPDPPRPAEPEAPEEAYPPFTLEIWDGCRIEKCVAAIWNLEIAGRAFAVAVELWPDRKLLLRQRACVIRKHPPGVEV